MIVKDLHFTPSSGTFKPRETISRYVINYHDYKLYHDMFFL